MGHWEETQNPGVFSQKSYKFHIWKAYQANRALPVQLNLIG